jgi:hypothetical protein
MTPLSDTLISLKVVAYAAFNFNAYTFFGNNLLNPGAPFR